MSDVNNEEDNEDEGDEGYRTGNWAAKHDNETGDESLNPYDDDDPDHEGFNAGYRNYYDTGEHLKKSDKNDNN